MNLTPLAVKLRKNQTDAERKLWSRLRAKRLEDRKWRRQQPLGAYIVDLICFEKRVIIELEGGQHMDQEAKDQIRDKWLKEQRYKVIRVWDREIFKNLAGVLETIREKLL